MKKVLSLVLALVLALGLTTVAFAADTKIELKDAKLELVEAPKDDVRPGAEFEFNIVLEDGEVTRADVRSQKIGVQVRATEGSRIVDKAEIAYRKGDVRDEQVAYVKLSLVEDFVSTKEQDFNILVYLTENKSRVSETEAGVSGVFANEVTTVYEGDDYVYTFDVPVVKAEDYIREITVDLGQGVNIKTRMFDGKKYYGKATQEIKAADEAILAQYADIDTVYYLETIGLAGSGNVVTFDLDDTFFVYAQNEDGDLVYVGKSNEAVPYFTKYFLAGKELEVEALEEDEVIEPEEEETPPVTGGDDEGTVANVNDNPSTGR